MKKNDPIKKIDSSTSYKLDKISCFPFFNGISALLGYLMPMSIIYIRN